MWFSLRPLFDFSLFFIGIATRWGPTQKDTLLSTARGLRKISGAIEVLEVCEPVGCCNLARDSCFLQGFDLPECPHENIHRVDAEPQHHHGERRSGFLPLLRGFFSMTNVWNKRRPASEIGAALLGRRFESFPSSERTILHSPFRAPGSWGCTVYTHLTIGGKSSGSENIRKIFGVGPSYENIRGENIRGRTKLCHLNFIISEPRKAIIRAKRPLLSPGMGTIGELKPSQLISEKSRSAKKGVRRGIQCGILGKIDSHLESLPGIHLSLVLEPSPERLLFPGPERAA